MLTSKLKDALRENEKLTDQLKVALRENEKLTNQLKHARLDGKSPLQRGDSNSKSPEEIEAIRKVTREWMLRKIDER